LAILEISKKILASTYSCDLASIRPFDHIYREFSSRPFYLYTILKIGYLRILRNHLDNNLSNNKRAFTLLTVLLFLLCLIFIVGIFNLISFKKVHKMSHKEAIYDNVKVKYINVDSLLKDSKHSVYDIDVSVDRQIYVADYRNNKIAVFDEDLNKRFNIENVSSPHGLTLDNKGCLYVGTFRSGRVRKFDPSGSEIKDWDLQLVKEKRIRLPLSLDVDTDNNVFIADYGLKTVIKVSSNGSYISSLDISAITKKGEFLPHCVITDKKKYVYVADRGKAKTIQIFTLDGKYVGMWHYAKRGFDPTAVRFLTPELVLIPNFTDSRLYLFDISGKYLTALGAYGDKPGEFLRSTNLISNDQGYVYVVEEESNRVQKIDFSKVIASYGKVAE